MRNENHLEFVFSAAQLGLRFDTKGKITGITKRGEAERLGILEGDLIHAVDGVEVTSRTVLDYMKRLKRPGNECIFS
jgi:S1-C subfamily serine protease